MSQVATVYSKRDLEAIVNAMGVENVVYYLAEICREKAGRLLNSHQSPDGWDKAEDILRETYRQLMWE